MDNLVRKRQTEMDLTKKSRSVTVTSMEEVSKHNSKDSMWIVVNNKVYDVTEWCHRHPGGAKIIAHYAGQDATDAWVAVHNDKELVTRYMKTYYVSDLVKDAPLTPAVKELRDLRVKLETIGLFRTNFLFYFLFAVHILLFELLAYGVISYYGNGWWPWILAAVLLATAQSQAGWLQHDIGHMAVFKDSRWNHIAHHIVIGLYKGASSHWWNFRHQQHHVKPNIIRKDPDIAVPYVFLIGRVLPKEWGERKRGFMPYNLQHRYFFMFGPPMLLPVYFHLEVLYFIFKRRDWVDIVMLAGFFVRYFSVYGPLMGVWSAFKFYLFARFLESHWFTWCTQMNHIPMEVDRDNTNCDWLTMQLSASCDVAPGWFTDWFSGHLNYQIEHHLFPTMPSHNYRKVQPLVKSLCLKHGLDYVCRSSLLDAWIHLVRSLKVSGNIWYDAYHSPG